MPRAKKPKIQTLSKAKEVAKRVQKSMRPDAPAPEPDLLPAVKVPDILDHAAVRVDTLYDAVEKTNTKMPSMVDDLLEAFFQGDKREYIDDDGVVQVERRPLSVEKRLKIFESLAKFALTDKRLEKSMGLLKDMAGANGGGVNIGNLNVLQLRELPHGEVDRRLKKLASGE